MNRYLNLLKAVEDAEKDATPTESSDGSVSFVSLSDMAFSQNESHEEKADNDQTASDINNKTTKDYILTISNLEGKKTEKDPIGELTKPTKPTPMQGVASGRALYDPVGLQRAADERNADAARNHSTDRFCRCGRLATFAWRHDGCDVWRCLECDRRGARVGQPAPASRSCQFNRNADGFERNVGGLRDRAPRRRDNLCQPRFV